MLCKKEYSFHGGTTNLCNHLSSAHPFEYSKQSSPTSRQKTLQLSRSCLVQCVKEITKVISLMIVKDLQPIRIVEDTGFISVLQFLEPGYI